MLVLSIPARELYDSVRDEIIRIPAHTLELEHSLVSISKWESKWKKPFFSSDQKTREQLIDYIRCMTIRPSGLPRLIYAMLNQEELKQIDDYINDSMTATWFTTPKDKEGVAKPKRQRAITSELIYSWMAMLNIDWSCEKWHINRLFVLIQCIEEQQKPPTKMSAGEIRTRNASLNAMRRKKFNSKG